MEEERNRSSEALPATENENSPPPNGGEGEIRAEIIEKLDEQRRVHSDGSSNCAVGNSLRGESKAPEFETLSSVQLSEGDLQADFDDSSHLLSEVPVEFSVQPIQSAGEVKLSSDDQVREVQSAAVEQSPTSVTQSISTTPNSIIPKPKLQPAENGNYLCLTEKNIQNSPGPKPLSTSPMQKTPSDGYNWRKYGQKQVKSPEGSRSYYRCTFSDCCAKKIECSDRSHRLIETVYRSHHNHDPPRKVNLTRENRENRPSLAIVPFNESKDTNTIQPVPSTESKDTSTIQPVPSTPPKESLPGGIHDIPEIKQQESSDSDQTTETNNTKEEYTDGSECKKRQKSNSADELESLHKSGKKSKYVVHAAVDVGISGDGYRWRKYGQKMVKGNPHPRNYYRCTSAGCPVRKHIETAVDNANAVVITYNGMHDHDTPLPRKNHHPKTATATNKTASSSSPVPLDNLQKNKTDYHTNRTQWSVEKEGELTGEAPNNGGGEKATGSARTLLSVGFEIKPC